MKKRFVKKHGFVKRRERKTSQSPFLYSRHSIIILCLITILVIASGAKLLSKPHVLGVSTEQPMLLADHGSDSGGGNLSGDSSSEGSSGGSSSGGSSNSGSNNSSGGGNNAGSNTSGGSGDNSGNNSLRQSVSDSTSVDCVGPDGKHFQTTFKNCADLNNSWHNGNFTFTQLSAPKQQTIQTQHSEEEAKTEQPEIKKLEGEKESAQKLEVKTENDKTEVKLQQEGTEVEFKQEGDRTIVKAKQPDGTEVELNTHDALEKINEALKETDVEVGTSAANGFTIKKGEVEADTHFPLSVDPITHTLTVTTPAGTKTVTVLPDQAVKNLLNNKIFTSIESEATPTTEQPTATTQKTTLTELNNEPVFEVKGINQKRILGLIPVGFAKTAFVSATTGQVVKIDESFGTKLLELLSI